MRFAKSMQMIRKRLCEESRRTRSWSCGVLKTREQTAPDLRRSEKSRGVARTRFSCLKARWRILLYYYIIILLYYYIIILLYYYRPADSIPTRVVYPDQDRKSCQDTRVPSESADSLLSWDPLRTAVFTRILHLPGYTHRLLLAHCKLNQVLL